jgi:hypothetical protein
MHSMPQALGKPLVYRHINLLVNVLCHVRKNNPFASSTKSLVLQGRTKTLSFTNTTSPLTSDLDWPARSVQLEVGFL